MTEKPPLSSIFWDEENKAWSFARVALGVTLNFTFYVVYRDALPSKAQQSVFGIPFDAWDVPPLAYGLLTTIIVSFVVWAGGARIGANLNTAISAVSTVVAAAMVKTPQSQPPAQVQVQTSAPVTAEAPEPGTKVG